MPGTELYAEAALRGCGSLGLLLLSLALPAFAQNQGLVVRDGSLGAAPAGVVAPGIDDLGQPADYLITADQGLQAGDNLFHSFEQFSVGAGETDTFTGPDSVDNVISRVTGASPSEIDGTLRSTIEGADVWLMNPNGIVFGEGAQLDVPAGFHASTADSLGFANGEVFEARAGGAVPLLALDPPEAFGFLGTNTAPIAVEPGAYLAVSEGAVLSIEGTGAVNVDGYLFSGGDVTVRGGTVTVNGTVSADGDSGGNVLIEGHESVAVYGPLSTIGYAADGGNITMRGGSVTANLNSAETYNTITVDTQAKGASAGTIRIEASDDVHIENSWLSAVPVDANFEGSWQGNGGEIHILGDGDVTIRNSSLLAAGYTHGGSISVSCSTEICANGLEMRDHAVMDVGGFFGSFSNGGDISIHVGTLDLDEQSTINAGAAYGAAGNIDIRGDHAVHIANTDGGPVDYTQLLEFGGFLPGVVAMSLGSRGGTLRIAAPSLVVKEGAAIVAFTGGLFGSGGSIRLEGETVEIRSGALVDASALFRNAGSIDILGGESVTISGAGVEGPSRIRSLAAGGGYGGSIYVSAPNIELDGGAIATSGIDTADTGFTGSGCDITLVASDVITLSGGTRIDGSTFSLGDGGAISLSAPMIWIEGAGTGVSARTGGAGDGGEVMIVAEGDLTIREGATIGAESRAGFAELEPVFGDASRLVSAILEFIGNVPHDPPTVAEGDAGRIEISAARVLLDSNGSIVASTSGPGGGGDIAVDAAVVGLRGGSSIFAKSTATGSGGSVFIAADDVWMSDGSHVAAESTFGEGGDVMFDVSGRLLLADTLIEARSLGIGNGANVAITARLLALYRSRIGARSDSEQGGAVTITALLITMDPQSGIFASGEIEISSPDRQSLVGALAALPEAALDATDQLVERCSARRTGERSGSFTIAGAALPPGPEGWLPAWRLDGGRPAALASSRCD